MKYLDTKQGPEKGIDSFDHKRIPKGCLSFLLLLLLLLLLFFSSKHIEDISFFHIGTLVWDYEES